PLTGGGLILDPVTGEIRDKSPAVAGRVRASVSDGKGGWFIGGSFSAVGGGPPRRLAPILADGRLAGWDAAPEGGGMPLPQPGAIRSFSVSDSITWAVCHGTSSPP